MLPKTYGSTMIIPFFVLDFVYYGIIILFFEMPCDWRII